MSFFLFLDDLTSIAPPSEENPILWEDGNDILWEDGSTILWES